MILNVQFGPLDVNVTVTIKNEMQDVALIEKIQILKQEVQNQTAKLQDATEQNKP